MQNFTNQVVVITGASSGIGRATALAFAERGAKLVLAARREDALKSVAQACQKKGGECIVIPLDVTDEHAVRKLGQQTLGHFGRIDVWVNNAAVLLFGRIEEIPMDDYRRVIDTNIMGYVYGAREAVKAFRGQGSGVLINVSSMIAKLGSPYLSSYAISKYGVIGLSNSLRQELLDSPQIHVSTVLPASIDTPMFDNAGNYTGRKAKPVHPIYDPSKVAMAIVKLAKNPKREVYVGRSARLLAGLHQIVPNWAERIMAKHVDRDHFQKTGTAPTEGNLRESGPGPARVSGHWRARLGTGDRTAQVASVAAALGGIALLSIMRSRRTRGGATEETLDDRLSRSA